VHRIARSLPLLAVLAACSDPPDDSPLGRETAALLARPEQKVEQVKVQHILIAFVGAKRGSDSNRTYEQAQQTAADVLARARKGEDFAALMKEFSHDEAATYVIKRDSDFAADFKAAALRLQPGEVGVVVHQRVRSPFGFHIIKRVE
jgi:ABC-type uncharacterized transport system auxiliary subunit